MALISRCAARRSRATRAPETDLLEPAGRRFANFFFEKFFFEIFRFWGGRWSSGVRGGTLACSRRGDGGDGVGRRRRRRMVRGRLRHHPDRNRTELGRPRSSSLSIDFARTGRADPATLVSRATGNQTDPLALKGLCIPGSSLLCARPRNGRTRRDRHMNSDRHMTSIASPTAMSPALTTSA